MPATSDPAFGSVREYAPIFRPDARSGKNRSRCSGVPHFSMGAAQTELWTVTFNPVDAHAREISSITIAYEMESSPAPLNFGEIWMPHAPISPSTFAASWSNRCSKSITAARGSRYSDANFRVNFCTNFWRGVREKSNLFHQMSLCVGGALIRES